MPSKARAFAKKTKDVEAPPSVKLGLKEGRSRRTLVLDDSQVEALAALAWLRRSSLSAEVRAALAVYLESNGQEVIRARKIKGDSPG